MKVLKMEIVLGNNLTDEQENEIADFLFEKISPDLVIFHYEDQEEEWFKECEEDKE